jgi:hypothetical protein
MTGDCHVRFLERLGGKFPWPTRLNTSNERDRPRIIWLRQRGGGSKKSGYENEIRTSREVG